MKKYLLANTKNAYKANLHAHTNISDGKLSPAELKELYKSNGYAVLAYTDHDVFIPHPELTDSEFIALSALEVQFNGSNRYPAALSVSITRVTYAGNSIFGITHTSLGAFFILYHIFTIM